jgi:hypothetical protein
MLPVIHGSAEVMVGAAADSAAPATAEAVRAAKDDNVSSVFILVLLFVFLLSQFAKPLWQQQ